VRALVPTNRESDAMKYRDAGQYPVVHSSHDAPVTATLPDPVGVLVSGGP
jgi:hypothetical protein